MSTLRIIRYIFSIRFALILGIVACLLLVSTRLLSFSLSAEKINQSFKDSPHQPVHRYFSYQEDYIHYVCIGDSTLPPILMIHGSPGSWDSYVKLVTLTDLLDHYYLIIPDRPGYGESGMSDARSLREQSLLLGLLVEQYFGKQNGILLGHSYGGALCLQLAVDFPDRIQSMVLAAGTLADVYQKPRWYNYLVKYTPVGWLLDGSFKLSNQEMMLLPQDLKKLYPELRKSSIRTAIIQGGKDFLVDPQTPEYISSILDNSKHRVFYKENMDHFLIWNDQTVIMDALSWATIPLN